MIQVHKEFLKNPNYIVSVIEQAKKEMAIKRKRYERYTRKKSNDIDVAMEYYIVNIASGYFGGVAPEISVKQETNEKKKSVLRKLFGKIVGQNADPIEFQIMIDHIREYNDDSALFYQLVKDYFITGSCYALQYENADNKLIYARVNPTQTVALYDYATPIEEVGIIRIWEEADSSGKIRDMVEIITNEEKVYWVSGQKKGIYLLREDMLESVQWLLVPAFSVENPDGLAIFSVVETLIDALERIVQNNKDTFAQNADAKLVVSGYAPQHDRFIQDDDGEWVTNPERTKEDNALLKAKVLYLEGDKENWGEFKWLLKELNDTASENHKKTLIDLIFMIASVPNVTDVGFTNADNASALEKKFFPLEQIIIQAQKLFQKEYLELFENFIDRVNTKYSTNFDASELQVTFKRNMPANDKEITDTWLSLRGLLSDETIIERLPFELDVETELARVNEETDITKFVGGQDVEQGQSEVSEVPNELQEAPTELE